MTHLLDTNAWLRFVGRPDALSPAARTLSLQSSALPFALSAISIWEVTLKTRKGKLELLPTLDGWLAVALSPRIVQVLPVDAAVARRANELHGFLHEDPADRLIVATALEHNLTIITSDHRILAYADVQTLW